MSPFDRSELDALGFDPAEASALRDAGIEAVRVGGGSGRIEGWGILVRRRHGRSLAAVLRAPRAPWGAYACPVGTGLSQLSAMVLSAREGLDESIQTTGILEGDPTWLVVQCRRWLGSDIEGVRRGGADAIADSGKPWDNGHAYGISGRWAHPGRLADGLAYHPDALCQDDGRVLRGGAAALLVRLAQAVADRLTEAMLGPARGVLGSPNWSYERALDLTSPLVPVEARRNRRQAATLYPALLPVILGDHRVLRAVDAGRPFEAELAAAINADLRADGGGLIDRARLRRMRTMPGTLWGPDVAALLMHASLVEPDHLPSDGSGWRSLAVLSRAVVPFAVRLGLPSAPLVREASDVGLDPARLSDSLGDAIDMVVSMHGGLPEDVPVGPEYHEQYGRRDDRLFQAGGLLFRGRSLRAVLSASEAWHAGTGAALSGRARGGRWPALFPDFTAGNGLVIRCLRTAAELKREGSDGPGGLDHCVATFAPSCRSGLVHVAAVRRPADSGEVPVSTVAFELLVPDREAGPIRIRVQQHRGRSNRRPPAEAEDAVHELMETLARGRLPEPVAMRARLGASGRGGGGLRLSPQEWLPHLAHRGWDGTKAGLTRLVREEVAARCPKRPVATPPADLPDLDDDLDFILNGSGDASTPAP